MSGKDRSHASFHLWSPLSPPDGSRNIPGAFWSDCDGVCGAESTDSASEGAECEVLKNLDGFPALFWANLLPDSFNSMKPIYEMAVMNVKRLYPKAQDARISSGDLRFRKTLSAAFWQEYKDWAMPEQMDEVKDSFLEMWSEVWKPRFIPDLWWIDEPNKAIHLYEIEGTHALTEEKLLLLERYWWHMDAIDWELTLTVFDRYGLNPRPLDLMSYALGMLSVIRHEHEKTVM